MFAGIAVFKSCLNTLGIKELSLAFLDLTSFIKSSTSVASSNGAMSDSEPRAKDESWTEEIEKPQ